MKMKTLNNNQNKKQKLLRNSKNHNIFTKHK